MKPCAPPACGRCLAKFANTHAKQSAPVSVITHASTAFPPYGAIEAGGMQVDAPTTLPTTNAVAAERPMRWRRED